MIKRIVAWPTPSAETRTVPVLAGPPSNAPSKDVGGHRAGRESDAPKEPLGLSGRAADGTDLSAAARTASTPSRVRGDDRMLKRERERRRAARREAKRNDTETWQAKAARREGAAAVEAATMSRRAS
jgi:hypothetical protein